VRSIAPFHAILFRIISYRYFSYWHFDLRDQSAENAGSAFDVIDDGERPHSSKKKEVASVNRREFLGGAAASLALQGVAFAAEEPSIVKQGDGSYVISYRGRTWDIRPSVFERRSHSPKLIFRDDGAVKILRLSHALYPGTNLAADFEATFYRRETEWYVRLGFAAFGQLTELPLRTWIAPRSDSAALPYVGTIKNRKVDLGRGGAISDVDDATLSLWSDFSGRLVVSDRLMAYRVGTGERQLHVKSGEVNFALGIPVAAAPYQKITRFTCSSASLEGDGMWLGRVGQSIRVKASMFASKVTIESSLDHGSHNADVEVAAAEGSLELYSAGTGPNGARIQLEDATLRFRGSGLRDRVRLRAHVARRDGGRGLETRFFTAVLEGDPSEVVDISFGSRPLASLSIKSKVVGAHVPVEGDAIGDVALAPATSCEILIKAHAQFSSPPEKYRTCDALVWIGNHDCGIQIPLEPARLRLRRSADLFDLSFGFLHYALQSDRQGTRIEQRWAFAGGCVSPPAHNGNAPRVIVHFAPQHVFEEAFLPPVPDLSPKPPTGTAGDACYKPAGRDPISGADLARTRISGPTRLVFQDKSAIHRAAQPLTVEYLTDWANLAMVVNKRALPRNATLEDQLKNVGIGETTSRLDARALVMAQARPPGEDETSIEAFYRVVLSPDKDAKWSTPSVPPVAGRLPEVWAARIKNQNETAVRALYARQMDIGFLTGRNTPAAPPKVSEFIGSLNEDDRRQIAALTSFYGLAALRRIIVSKNGKTAGDDPNGMVFLPNNKYRYLDATDYKRSSDGTGQYPDDQDELSSLPQEGVMLAKPFDRFDLTLSRSATIDALWQGEPAAGLTLGNDPFFSPAFTIERYLHRIRDGRDAFVEVTYKGFLFPLGHRAALLKVTRREFHPYQNTDQARPIAYLIQHLYIVCRKPLKTYRAFNQPFESNDFPPATIELKTIQTPDLADPESPVGFGPSGAPVPGGDVCRPVPTNGAATIPTGVFWPTLLDPNGRGGAANPNREVMFEYAIDGQEKLARSPLLFVDNAAAHDPVTMNWVADYYNNTIAEAKLLPAALPADDLSYLRVVDHGGVPRRYANEQKDGQCTFDTASWVLGARGLVRAEKGVGEVQDFHMDAFMEGRDQPPFYPLVKRAAINVQSVNRLIGRRENLIAVEYNPRYVRSGFDPERNPAEIFLNVLEPRIYLDASSDGKSTGGVAKPNAQLAALSRKIGPVGGQLPSSSLPAPKLVVVRAVSPPGQPPVLAVGVTEPATSPVSSAMAGQFNPLEYFLGAANEARLLGIIPLKDILKAVIVGLAPKLVERAQYLANEVSDEINVQLQSLRKALADALGVLETEVRSGRDSLKNNLIKTGGANADPAALYPALWGALNSTLLAIGDAKKGLANQTGNLVNDLSALSAVAGALIAQVNLLLREIRAVARDPMPANVRDAISKVKDYWDRIQAIANNRDLINQFAKDFADTAFHEVCEAIVDADLFESVFGPLHLESGPYDASQFPDPRPQNKATKEEMRQACRQLLRDPAGTLPRLQEALFYEAFSEPLVRAIDQFRAFKAQVSGTISQALQYSRRALADRIAVILRQKTENAELEILTVAAYTIAGAIVQGLESLVDAELTSDKIKGAIEARVLAVDATIVQQIGLVRQAAQAESQRLTKRADDKLAEAQEELEKQHPDQYYFFVSQSQKWYSRAAALNALAGKLAGLDEKALGALRADIKEAVYLLVQPAVDDAKAAVIENLKAQAAGWTRRIMQLADTLLTQALNTASAVAMAEASKQVDQWCGSAGGTADKLVLVAEGLSHKVIGPIDKTRTALQSFETSLTAILITVDHLNAPAESEPTRQQLARLLSAIAVNNQSLIALIDEFERDRSAKSNADTWKNICSNFGQSISNISHVIDIRRRIAETLAVVIDGVGAALLSASDLSIRAKALTGVPAIERLLTELLSQVIDLAASVTSIGLLSTPDADGVKVDNAIKEFGAKVGSIDASWKELKNSAQEIKNELDRTKADINNAATDVKKKISDAVDRGRSIVQFSRQDRKFVATILENCFAGSALQARLNKAVRAGLKKTVEFLIEVTKLVFGVVESLAQEFSAPTQPAMIALASIVPAGSVKNLVNLRDALKVDWDALLAIKAELVKGEVNPSIPIADTLRLTQQLQKRWRDNPPAAISAIQFIEQIIGAVASGHIQELIDVSLLERRLRDAIVDLIPARVSLSYDFDAELPNFPSGSPIFSIDRDSPYYKPESGNDLVISTHVELNVLTGDRSVNASGHIRPFKIQLVGSSLDLITLKFKGAEFLAKPGGGTDFKADIAGFKIGAALQFLSALSSLGGGGNKSDKKNGFYYEYSVLPPEVEVGYRFNKPLLLLGSLTFQNIGFAVSAHLPFDYRHAEFRASFATREKPFLVSQPTPIPLGGGGFVGLRASAKGIVAFEISLEFGAVAAIEIGPLAASGRITVGMYLLSYQDGGRRFEGFMHAVGEGHIACFGLSFLIEVRTVQNGSSMEGSATYSFSFEVASFEVSYSLTATSSTEGGGGANAKLQHLREDTPADKARKDPKKRVVRTTVPPKMSDWQHYARHFQI
jgi:hypothetical protein